MISLFKSSLFKTACGFFAVSVFSAKLWAAACCGGGFAAPALITGDDRMQMTTSYARTQVVVDHVDEKGLWRQWDQHQSTQKFEANAAWILSDRWQAGVTVPVVQRQLGAKQYTGFGDVSGSVGYEFLPDWSYHPYRPKGVGYLQLTLPTGKGRAESDNGLDTTGNGFWALGTGALLTKTFGHWDTFTSLEIHHSFEKNYSNSQTSGTLRPNNGMNVGLGAGFNTANFRYGGSIGWTFEDPIEVSGTANSKPIPERYATGIFSVSYMASDEWAATFNYVDQTLFGDPLNTSLGRGFAVLLQRRWAR